tara:strand:- start:1569 stop:1814 length:246 start_codon:yes stop_codon:yes gene_type:complete
MVVFKDLQTLIETTTAGDLELMIGLRIADDMQKLCAVPVRTAEEDEACLFSLLNDTAEGEFCLQMASTLLIKSLLTYMQMQ